MYKLLIIFLGLSSSLIGAEFGAKKEDRQKIVKNIVYQAVKQQNDDVSVFLDYLKPNFSVLERSVTTFMTDVDRYKGSEGAKDIKAKLLAYDDEIDQLLGKLDKVDQQIKRYTDESANVCLPTLFKEKDQLTEFSDEKEFDDCCMNALCFFFCPALTLTSPLWLPVYYYQKEVEPVSFLTSLSDAEKQALMTLIIQETHAYALSEDFQSFYANYISDAKDKLTREKGRISDVLNKVKELVPDETLIFDYIVPSIN